MTRAILISIVLAGCGGSKDTCEQLADKMKSVATADELHGFDRDRELARCRKSIDRIKNDPAVKCILDADGSDAIKKCLQPALDADKDKARLAAEEARQRADEAVKSAKEASEKLDAIARDADELDKKVEAALQIVTAAQNDADRKAAMARLEQLRRDKADMERRIAEAKAAAARAERLKGVHISKECMDNPLAKGCS